MYKCIVRVKGIKCPTHSATRPNQSKQDKGAGPISKRLFDLPPNQSRDKRLMAKFGTKEQNSSIPFTFPSPSRWHCPQNCKKEISSRPKKCNKAERRSKGTKLCKLWVRGAVGSGFLTGNIGRWVPAALAKMATAGRICNASRGISSI